MNIFCFPSESVNHILAAHTARQWAANSHGIAEGFKKQLITKMSHVERGDLGFLYCKEDKKFHLPFTIVSSPFPEVEYSSIWHSEWIGRFCFVPWISSVGKGLPIEEVENVMPTIKEQINTRPQTENGRRTTWNTYLQVCGQHAFNPLKFVKTDDFVRMVVYLQLMDAPLVGASSKS